MRLYALLHVKRYITSLNGTEWNVYCLCCFFYSINASVDALSKVYIVPALSFLCFAAIIGCYLYREECSFKFWLIGACISLFAFVNLREDSIWTMLFVLAALFLTALYIKGRKSWLYCSCYLSCLWEVSWSVCNITTHMGFTPAQIWHRALLQICWNHLWNTARRRYFSCVCSRSTVDKLYEVSDTLLSVDGMGCNRWWKRWLNSRWLVLLVLMWSNARIGIFRNSSDYEGVL